MAPSGTIPPPISWAQRKDLLYITIDVECKDFDHKVTENSFHFKGTNVLDANKVYDVTLNFLHPVDPEKVTSKNIGRCLEFTIFKKEDGPFWSKLTNDKTKLHFLKANFAKWESESDNEDYDNMMKFDKPTNDYAKKFDDMFLDEDYDSDDNIPSLAPNDEDDEDTKKNEVKDSDLKGEDMKQ